MIEVAFYDTKQYDLLNFQNERSSCIRWNFQDFRLTNETAASVKGSSAVCVFVNDQLDDSCLRSISEYGVRAIALRCAGFNNVDLVAAKNLGLTVVRVPSYSPHAVAEHSLGLLLALNRKIHRAYNRVREHNFSLNGLVGFDIAGKNVGIIGTGKIGKIGAQIFRGFQANVLAHDLFPDKTWAEQHGITYADFETLLSLSDIVSLHLPLTPNTKHLLNAEAFAKMKQGVYLVNTSRGKLIHTSSLIQALKSAHIGGVALDVYEEEEGIFFEDRSEDVILDDVLSRLLTFPNVLITAHQGFLTQEALREIGKITKENLLRFSRGEEFLPDSVVLPR